MDSIQRLITTLRHLEPKAADYVEEIMGSYAKHSQVVGCLASQSRQVARKKRRPSDTLRSLFSFRRTPQGYSYWDGVMMKLMKYEATWFGEHDDHD